MNPYTDDLGVVRPVQWWMNLLLSGQIAMDDTPAAIQSWSRLFIHNGAISVMRLDNKQERRDALDKIPASIRPYVEAELGRIWPMRRTILSTGLSR